MGVKNTKPTIKADTAKKKESNPTDARNPKGVRHLVLKDGRRKVLEWRKA